MIICCKLFYTLQDLNNSEDLIDIIFASEQI